MHLYFTIMHVDSHTHKYIQPTLVQSSVDAYLVALDRSISWSNEKCKFYSYTYLVDAYPLST
jgi:hypothetical protein